MEANDFQNVTVENIPLNLFDVGEVGFEISLKSKMSKIIIENSYKLDEFEVLTSLTSKMTF